MELVEMELSLIDLVETEAESWPHVPARLFGSPTHLILALRASEPSGLGPRWRWGSRRSFGPS